VAEDSTDLLEAIVFVLLEQGYQTQAAGDGLEAVTMFQEFEPDLVVLDMRMPKMSGSDACAAIRQTSDVPIIMFTSSNNAAEVRDAIHKGATDFVLKSTGVSVLTERIKFHLAKRQPLDQDPATQETTVITARKQVSTRPPEQLRTTSLIIDPDEESREIIRAVFERLNQDVIEVGTAADAIAAFEHHDPDIVITEWSLPDMDAFTMMSELKRDRNAKNVFKIAMSTRLAPEAQRKAHYVGITDFLYKPFDGAKVETIIAVCVRKALRNLRRRASKAA
jgi:DNA-binding response OmpR family regulator